MLIHASKFIDKTNFKKLIGLGLHLSNKGPIAQNGGLLWISIAIAAAINAENLEIVSIILEKAPNQLNEKGSFKDLKTMENRNGFFMPIHLVQSVECLKMLIKAGADVNCKDSFGNTTLHHAALK